VKKAFLLTKTSSQYTGGSPTGLRAKAQGWIEA
jgi:hypothetical protein